METNLAQVYGVDYTLPDSAPTKGVAIEFLAWEEWLMMEIGRDAFEEWDNIEIVCHAMYEMTLEGFTQEEIQTNFNLITAKANKLKERYLNSKTNTLYSIMDDSKENPPRFQNEVRKLKLQAETGAKFFTDPDKLSARQEADFLDYIKAFNKAAEEKEFRKVGEILGNPVFPDPQSIEEENLAIHLEKAYQLLNENNISLDVLYNVPDEEIYRFIVEDLMEYEMSVIDVPGVVSCFTYEEFYPEDLKCSQYKFYHTSSNEEHKLYTSIKKPSQMLQEGKNV